MALGHGACPCCRWCPGLSLLPGPLKGNLPWLATPNTATVNMIPSLSGGGVPRRGRCALVLCPPPRAGPVLLCPNSKAKLGASTPPLPGCGFKAAGQCKLGFPGPARLLLLLRASVLPAEAASLQGASDVVPAPQTEGSTSRSQARCVCLMRDTEQFLPSPRLGSGGPKQEYILTAWFLFRILCWHPGSRLRGRKGAMAGCFQ